jgi:hypothetical protein
MTTEVTPPRNENEAETRDSGPRDTERTEPPTKSVPPTESVTYSSTEAGAGTVEKGPPKDTSHRTTPSVPDRLPLPVKSSSPDISVTQESAAIPELPGESQFFLERRIVVLEEEVRQLHARVRLGEKTIEEARRLAMAASLFAVGAMLVAKLLGK